MPEPENRAPQFVYDGESEFPHDEGRGARRRRPVADWGGDELFTRMPRRRSVHAGPRTQRFARLEDDVAPAARVDEWRPAEPDMPDPEPPIADFERQAELEPPTEDREPRRAVVAEHVTERMGDAAPAVRRRRVRRRRSRRSAATARRAPSRSESAVSPSGSSPGRSPSA